MSGPYYFLLYMPQAVFQFQVQWYLNWIFSNMTLNVMLVTLSWLIFANLFIITLIDVRAVNTHKFSAVHLLNMSFSPFF